MLVVLAHVFKTPHGAIGVDIFFVISGFVICLAATKRHHHPLEFFLARVARVSPLYLIIILFLLGKGLVNHLRIPRFSAVWNDLFYLPIFDWHNFTEPTLPPGWTLCFEMWFYTVFALLLNFWNPRKVALVLPMVFAVGAILMTPYHGAWYFPRFMFHPFTLEFALGCLVFHMQRRVSVGLAWMLAGVGLVAMLALASSTGQLGWPEALYSYRIDLAWYRVLLWGVPSALLAAGLVGLERHVILILPRVLVWLGEMSYSLYLTHMVALWAMADVAPRLGLHNLELTSILDIGLCLLIGWLCWRWVEKPLTSRAQRLARQISIREGSLPG